MAFSEIRKSVVANVNVLGDVHLRELMNVTIRYVNKLISNKYYTPLGNPLKPLRVPLGASIADVPVGHFFQTYVVKNDVGALQFITTGTTLRRNVIEVPDLLAHLKGDPNIAPHIEALKLLDTGIVGSEGVPSTSSTVSKPDVRAAPSVPVPAPVAAPPAPPVTRIPVPTNAPVPAEPTLNPNVSRDIPITERRSASNIHGNSQADAAELRNAENARKRNRQTRERNKRAAEQNPPRPINRPIPTAPSVVDVTPPAAPMERPAARPPAQPAARPQSAPVQRRQPTASAQRSHFEELGIKPRDVADMTDKEALLRYQMSRDSTATAITSDIRSTIRRSDIAEINEATKADINALSQGETKATLSKTRQWARDLNEENIILPIGNPLNAVVIEAGHSTRSVDIGTFYEIGGRLMFKTVNSGGIIRHINADALLGSL